MKIKVFLCLAIFSLITSTVQAQNKYPPLTGNFTECNTLNTLNNTCDIDVRHKSEVSPYNPSQDQLDKFYTYWNKFYQVDLRKETLDLSGWYLYTYTFENKSKYKTRLNLSEWAVTHSPLTTILQDFSIILNPGEVRVIKFLSPSKPSLTTSAVNAGFWEKYEIGKWGFAGIGRTGLYIPERSTLFLEVR